jgi:uncharacterized membrane protein
MNYNPYAAPQAPPPQQPNAQGGMPQPWEIGEVLTQAWTAFKANWVVYVVAFLVATILSAGPAQSPRLMVSMGALEPNSLAFFGTSGGTSLIGILIGAFFRTGLVRINLAAARGQTPVMADLFSGGPLFLRMFGLQLLMMVAYGTGCAVFVVGMVFVMLMFCLSDYYLVDANMGVIDSMRASYEATKGQWGSLFIFGLVAFGLAAAGVVACCVGVIPAGAVISIAMAIIYTRMSGRGAVAAAPQYPQQPPPGGYAPPGAGYGPPGGGYGGPPPGGGGYPPPGGGGYGPPPGGGGGYGPPPGGGGGGYPPPGGGAPPGGGYGPPR